MMKRTELLWLLLGILAVGSFAVRASAQEKTLKAAFAADFRVGVALGTAQIEGAEPQALELAAQQFNATTPENLMKWAPIHPELEKYNFEPADKYVAWGEAHGMFVGGHTLVWHNQTPKWVFEDAAGQPIGKDALLARMRDHIYAVVGRYKGRVKCWDVVNEAVDDDGSLRQTPWLKIIGPEYLAKAFQFAHEADPAAELYYNDFNEWHAVKRAGIIKLVRDLQQQGVQVDGLGLQGHWGLDYPQIAEIEEMFDDYARLGVKLMITEVDMDVLPKGVARPGADVERREASLENPYRDGLPPKVVQAQTERYAAIFAAFVRHRDLIDRVTFWGVHDGHSWLNDWPMRGRTAYPLLFDRKYQPKGAYAAVLSTATEAAKK